MYILVYTYKRFWFHFPFLSIVLAFGLDCVGFPLLRVYFS